MADAELCELRKSLDEFGRSKKLLAKLLDDVKRAYEDLDGIVPKPRQTGSKKETTLDLRKVLLTGEDVQRVQKVLQEPKIVVVGQTNSGKSSMINELLGATVVTVDDIPCTARIVELQHGPTELPTIEIVKDGRVISSEQLQRKSVPAGVINLTEDHRNNPEMIGSIVRVKIKNAFLESGIQVVDSPGKNEYKELDDLISNQMDSVLPLVVYVIDGKGLLTQPEVDDISSLKRTVHPGNIFYVVSKCDNQSQMDRDETDPIDDEEEETDKTKRSKMEISIRETIYKKLLENNSLEKPIEEATNYHTISSRYVKQYRRTSTQKDQNRETRACMKNCKRFFDDFQNFKSSLFQFIGRQLVNSVMGAINILITSLLTCVDYFMDTSNQLLNDKRENARNIEFIEKQEPKLFREIIDLVKEKRDDIRKAIAGLIRNKRDNLIQMSKEFQYVKFDVPSDGRVDAERVGICQEELRNGILVKVGDLVHDEVLRECADIDNIFKHVEAKVKSVQKQLDINIHDALQLMFVRNYKFDHKSVKLTKSLWNKIAEKIRAFLSFAKLAPVLWSVKNKVKVTDEKWKEDVAKNVLEALDPDQLSQAIVDGICDYIKEGHEKFQTMLQNLKRVHDESKRLGEKDRELIRQMAPRMLKLLLDGWNITDRQRYGKPARAQVLGQGAQGIVFSCDVKGPNRESCVVKVIQVDKEEKMTDLAIGIHYSRKLKHDNLAPIYASMYDTFEENNTREITILMPRYKCDLLEMLPKLKSLKERLQITVQVAEAILYLHQLGLTHRGVSCANVMLDENHNAKLTDYGLCKPPSLVKVTFIGAPLHMAPEIAKNDEHDNKVDVYAFGILFWYLCEGTGNHPSYVYEHKWHDVTQALLVDTTKGLRPERPRGIGDSCWKLMRECWRVDPRERPAMNDVVQRLQEIVTSTR